MNKDSKWHEQTEEEKRVSELANGKRHFIYFPNKKEEFICDICGEIIKHNDDKVSIKKGDKVKRHHFGCYVEANGIMR